MYNPSGSGGDVLGGATRVRELVKAMALTVSNTTGSQVIGTVTGSVLVYGLWAEVTTAISNNHTAGFVRTNDQTATIDVTLNTGITLSSLLAGTIVAKAGLTGAALTLHNNSAARFLEPATAGIPSLSPFIVTKKTAATTTIDYRYSTTNTPATGVLTWHVLWIPLSGDGNLA